MDLKEILREAGIEDKVIKQITTTMKAEKLYITNEENADIRLKKNKEKLEKLEEDYNSAVEKLDSFKELEAKNTELTNTIETMKKEASNKEFNSALESALKEAKIKDSKLVKALLDNEKIKLNEGKLEGLNEQLEAIKKDYDYLFEKEIKGIPDFQTGVKTNTEPKNEDSVGTRLGKQRAEQIKDSGINKFIK